MSEPLPALLVPIPMEMRPGQSGEEQSAHVAGGWLLTSGEGSGAAQSVVSVHMLSACCGVKRQGWKEAA